MSTTADTESERRTPSLGRRADSAPASSQGLLGDRRSRLLTAMVIALPAVVAAVLCGYELTTRSLWLDESATVAIATQHGAAFGSALAHDGGNMLGYYGLLHVLIGAFGSGTVVIRLPSVIAATGTVALIAALALRLFDRRIGLAAGLLGAVSLPLVYWGQNARGYMPMVALVTASFLALAVALGNERPRPGAWVAYAVLLIGAVYAGLEAVLVIPAQLVLVARHRDHLRHALLAAGATLICCAPLAVLAAARGSGQLFWVPGPSFTTAKQVLDALASSGLQPGFYTATGGVLLGVTLAVLAVALLRAGPLLRGNRTLEASFGPSLALAWLGIPVALALLESAFGQSIFQARYLLICLPAVSLLLAWTLLTQRAPVALGVAVLATLLGLRALQIAPSYGVSSENWRGVTARVLAETRPGDCMAFYPLDNRMPFRYYAGASGPAPRSILPSLPWREVRPYVEDYAALSPSALAQLPGRCGRVFLLSSHEGKLGGPPISRGNYTRLVALEAGLRKRYPHVVKTSFGKPKTITLTLFSR